MAHFVKLKEILFEKTNSFLFEREPILKFL